MAFHADYTKNRSISQCVMIDGEKCMGNRSATGVLLPTVILILDDVAVSKLHVAVVARPVSPLC